MTPEKEKAIAYKQMFELMAWKDFKEFLADTKETAINKIIASDDLKEIHMNRGIIKCINSVESHLEYATK